MRICSLPWEQSHGYGSCNFCCRPIRKGWLWARFSKSWIFQTPRCHIILTNLKQKTWCVSAARVRFCITRPALKHCKSCCSSCMRSAAPATKRSSQKQLCSSANKEAAMSSQNMKEVVKEKYGQAALRVTTGGSSCCGSSPSSAGGCGDPITSNLYDASQAGEIRNEAMLASLGCGNPTALARLNPGEVVLDLGSGGGIDVLLSAKRVGPT